MSRIVEDVGMLLGEMAAGNFRIRTTAEDAYVAEQARSNAQDSMKSYEQAKQ